MRNRFAILSLLSLLGTLLAPGQAPRPVINEAYDPTGKSQTALQVTPLLNRLPLSGYFPIRVRITNDSKVDRSWNFDFLSTDFDAGADGNELRSSFSVSCDAGSTREVELIVPLVTVFLDGYDTSATLKITVRAPAPLYGSGYTISTNFSPSWPSVMCSEELYNRNGSALSNALDTKLSGTSSAGPSLFPGAGRTVGLGLEFGAVFSPEFMSDDWRAYSGYDACLLTENGWDELPVGAKTALLKWSRLGGSLLVFTDKGSTDIATLGIDKGSQGQRDANLGWGMVQIETYTQGGMLPAETTVDLVLNAAKRSGGFRIETLRDNFRSAWPLQVAFGEKTAHIMFFIVVLVIFGILVGPVNLFVFARAGRRHRLFITTPIISLAASIILVILILFQDGFGGRGQRIVLHEVGPDNTAYIAQEQIARTGVLLNTGFTTSDHGYLSPVMIEDSDWARVREDNGGGEGRYGVKLTETGLQVTGDWFQSRSEHGHLFETIRPSRGRVNLVPGTDPPVINSTFEFPLEALYYRDHAGATWFASAIRQGSNAALTAIPEDQFTRWLDAEQKRFGRKNQSRIGLSTRRKGRFFAVTQSAPGLETIESVDWSETHTFLTGDVLEP